MVQIDADQALIQSAEPHHYVWVGAKIDSLLLATGSAAGLDPGNYASSIIRELLAHVCRPDGSLIIELRFVRDPQKDGIQAAFLCRVVGFDVGSALSIAMESLELLVANKLASMSQLRRSELLLWLRALPSQPEWARTASRRLIWPDQTMPSSEHFGFSSLVASVPSWNRLLDTLLSVSTPAALGVRLQGTVATEIDERVLRDELEAFWAFAVDQYDKGAAALGVTRLAHRASPFAKDAYDALQRIWRQWSRSRFYYQFTASGFGGGDVLKPAIEALVPSRDDAVSPGFRSGALCAPAVDTKWLLQLDQCQQSLNFGNFDRAGRPFMKDSISRLVDTLDLEEAASLFHVPRIDPSPTPGFDVPVEVEIGFPLEPFVFVSYDHDDEGVARQLVHRIRSWGVAVWWDAMIPKGIEWRDTLYEALSEGRCRAVVVVHTERTHRSIWISEEIETARKENIPAIQVVLRPAPLLRPDLQAVDLAGWLGAADGRLERLRVEIERSRR